MGIYNIRPVLSCIMIIHEYYYYISDNNIDNYLLLLLEHDSTSATVTCNVVKKVARAF